MGDFGELPPRIEKATAQIEDEFRETLKKVEELKGKMNGLELEISHHQQTRNNRKLENLNSTIRRLNRLTDRQVLRSKKAWEQYTELEHDCKQHTIQPIQMDSLRNICKKMGQLAADLLCYSLARFEPSKQ